MGYDIKGTSGAEMMQKDFLNNSDMAGVDAVKNGHVYMISEFISIGGASGLLGAAYQAKQFHPDLFKDLDPRLIHQEYLDKFQGVDYDIKEHEGAFIYPQN